MYGVGINDADYEVKKSKKMNGKWKIVWMCPYYDRWTSMLSRCYSKKLQETHPTYKGCSVCDEWLRFSNFKKWMEEQNWEGRQLDKDFLFENNKVYSPSTCLFIPNKLNSFIITSGKARGEYPLGVHYMKKARDMINEHSNPYQSQVSDQKGKIIYLGM